ncbi:MAG: response regulator transcription factor [Kistimonas sp.]|nr:response regulator transcription factor [Kistimonas sp.]
MLQTSSSEDPVQEEVTGVVLFVGGCGPWCAQACACLRQPGELTLVTAGTAHQVRTCLGGQRPDLVVLDMSLPDDAGLEFYWQVRAESSLPVLALVSGPDGIDEVRCLDLGADDCIEMGGPVRARVLLARVRALLRRRAVSGGLRRVLGPLVVNAAARELYVSGRQLSLSGCEFDLLWLLCTHAGQVMTREDIFRSLRGIAYNGRDRSIDVLVSRLRSKIGDDARKSRLIKTIRSRGYMLVNYASR